VRVMTWNLQGSHGVDIAAVAAVVRAAAPDVLALQEVQRRQVERLAGALAMPSRCWVLKHWPVVHRAEGLAVLTPHPLVEARRFVLRRSWIWGWRRRVGVDVTVRTGAGPVRVIDVHLSPHDHGAHRLREVRILLAHAGRSPVPPVVVGDLNELPGGGALGALATAGWRDAWAAVHDDDGATNWTGGRRGGRPPTQRIDYVLVPAGADVGSAVVIRGPHGDGVDHIDAMAELSDHLPLVVELRPTPGGAT